MATRRSAIRKKDGAYHHGDLKESLKRAALRLVRDKGPRGFSLNEASRLAGVTSGAPYKHFEDKDALLAEIACDGLDLMVRDLRGATVTATDIHERMLEAGMAYLRFSSVHSDYFAVIFNAGLDKAKYSELRRAAEEAFGVILELSQELENSSEIATERALSAWALVHGLATLSADGALSIAAREAPRFEHLRPVLRNFLNQPWGRPRRKRRTANPCKHH